MLRALSGSFRPALLSLAALLSIFLMTEPAVSGAATAASQFTVSQQVGKEIAFISPASNVSMAPVLGGITGGTANGSVQVAVVTNSSAGYQMAISASSSVGMIGTASSSNSIPALVTATPNVPDYNFNTAPANKAYFAYTVEASSTADLDPKFKDNGSTCNTGSADAVGQCWLNASTTQVYIINRSFNTPATGASTTLKFRVIISANPSPIIPDDIYVATTTLTATTN